MIEKRMVIKNRMGLHARPSAAFVEIASQYECDIVVGKDGVEVNGKSIMGLLLLVAEMGSEIILRTNGVDEEAAHTELEDFLNGTLD